MSDSAAKVIASLASGATAAGIGAVASGGSTAGAATAFNADMNNRQLHPAESKLIKDNAKRYAQQRYGTANPTAAQIQGAEIELTNTAQNLVDNNSGLIVPKFSQAEAFLNQLKVEYAQTTGSVNIPGTSGQSSGTQQVFYANTEQKNMPWLNQGLADPTVTGLIVKSPINPPKPTDKADPTRDRMTGLPLDDKGRYTVNVALGDPINGYANYAPKFLPCASADCIRTGKNLDMSDSSTQAYVKALDAQVFKDINTAATVGTIVSPVGVAGNSLGVLGPLTSIAAGFMEDKLSTAFAKEGLQLAAASYLKTVYGVSDVIANRITATVDLAGGWQAFIDRMKSEIEKGSK